MLSPAPQAAQPLRRIPPRAAQQGMVLLMSIIVMVALTLASLALVRSVYTSNVIAGNLAFQRAATHSAEAGIEAAVSWLEAPPAGLKADCAADAQPLFCDQKGTGYLASRRIEAQAGQEWDDAWAAIEEHAVEVNAQDKAGNRVSYVIERMCKTSGDPVAVETGCTVSPAPGTGTCSGGSSCAAGEANLESRPPVYYRITVRVDGPRNTQSLVQAMVAL